VQYGWAAPVRIDGARVNFFHDQPAGASVGVAPPRAWHLEFWTKGAWKTIPARYSVADQGFSSVSFAPITTTCLRAVFDASGKEEHAGVGVQEWEVLAPRPVPVHRAGDGAQEGCPKP
jgi:hypothetical protein